METATQQEQTQQYRRQPSQQARDLAREWLEQWGEDIRLRSEAYSEFRALYAQTSRDGLPVTPKAIDDPSAGLMKHVTVHAALEALASGGKGVAVLAHHIWVKQRPLHEYNERHIFAALEAYGKSRHASLKFLEGVRAAIVDEVARSIEDTYQAVLRRRPVKRSEVA